ncbi:MAG TPA: ABC transporter ATP-binding protein [Acidimicrobiales bacterium]|jgi:NitT/TauT family transport system ATP-binding protein|nr:ABC transporter ATP-binding protein [Acidimicrobiales bacterium]
MVAVDGAGVVIDEVSKGFVTADRHVDVLDRVSLDLRRGEFVTVIGPSGCGKSTLLRVVAGLLPADRGRVSIFGETVEKAATAKHIGFVPQSPALLPWRSVIDNVRLPTQVNRRAAADGRDVRDPEELLRAFGLGGVLDRYPSQLSGGMQQRVAIARAYVFGPAVLLMDEPFSALDELTREVQRHELLDFWQANRKTVLFVTHSVPEAVALSDRIVVMSARPGRVHAVIDVDLARPRRDAVESTPAFHELVEQVRDTLRAVWRPTDD